jgi:tetratricopeptide (TPR) repeat protein
LKRQHLLLFTALCGLFLSGCLELIRRPEGDRSPSASATPASFAAIDNPSILPTLQDTAENLSAGDVAPRPQRTKRTRQQAKSTRQVNEYALWCIDHSMWNEARSHMERGLAQDSTSASLHNNLAIVYEHFGQTEKAIAFYRRAGDLNPEKERYQANLHRLEKLQQAVNDTSGKIDIFDLKRRIPGTRRDPYQRRNPAFQ